MTNKVDLYREIVALNQIIETRLEALRHEAAALNEMRQVLTYKKELLSRLDGDGFEHKPLENADTTTSQAD
jgi:prefoldin subunit 5